VPHVREVLSRARVLPVLTIERAENAVELARALAAEGSQSGPAGPQLPTRPHSAFLSVADWAALRSHRQPDGRIGCSLRLDR
jgi:hypothetical protein